VFVNVIDDLLTGHTLHFNDPL